MSQFDHCQLQLVYLIVEKRPTRTLQHETLQTTFDMFSLSQYLLHILHKSFFVCFSCVFTFLEIIRHNMLKILHIFSHLQYKNGYKKSPILGRFFLMHADKTAVTMQSKKTVLNEVKDN